MIEGAISPCLHLMIGNHSWAQVSSFPECLPHTKSSGCLVIILWEFSSHLLSYLKELFLKKLKTNITNLALCLGPNVNYFHGIFYPRIWLEAHGENLGKLFGKQIHCNASRRWAVKVVWTSIWLVDGSKNKCLSV